MGRTIWRLAPYVFSPPHDAAPNGCCGYVDWASASATFLVSKVPVFWTTSTTQRVAAYASHIVPGAASPYFFW